MRVDPQELASPGQEHQAVASFEWFPRTEDEGQSPLKPAFWIAIPVPMTSPQSACPQHRMLEAMPTVRSRTAVCHDQEWEPGIGTTKK